MFAGGKVNYDKKKQNTCLLTLIKYKSRDLYDLICDLCLDGTFRSQRYENTFLMPNDALVKHIEKLVESDKDVEAIDAIRSLLLKGHLKKTDFKKDATIGTLQFGSKILSSPEDVAKHIVDANVTMVTVKKDDKRDSYATIVYEYNSSSVPATQDGKSPSMIQVGTKKGGAVNEDVKTIRDITKSLVVYGDASATTSNFFKAVAGVLIMLEDKDESRFNRAKYYLAANPILAWFFLTMPGRKDALISASELKGFHWQAVSDLEIIKKAEESGDYKLDKGLLKKIKSHRSINEKGDRSSLIGMINSAYKEMLSEAKKVQAVDDMLYSNADLKMLMDELRFIHESSINSWGQVDDALMDLGAIEWNKPDSSKVICNCETYDKHLIKGVEAFLSGPVTFVKSIYFMYVPLTKSVEEQLIKAMEDKHGGSIAGGNPTAINNVIFSGGAARKQLSKKSDVSLNSLVKILSKAQRKALKELL